MLSRTALAVVALAALSSSARAATPPCAPLPAPSATPLDAFEDRLAAFLVNGCYQDNPGFVHDYAVRNAGPTVALNLPLDNQGTAYSPWDQVMLMTHKPVLIYYSESAYRWMHLREQHAAFDDVQASLGRVADGTLTAAVQKELDRQLARTGKVAPKEPLPAMPDGAMLIKEMWTENAQHFAGVDPEDLHPTCAGKDADADAGFVCEPCKAGADVAGADCHANPAFAGWAVMIRDSAGSNDGWFWSFYAYGQANDWPPTSTGDNVVQNQGFGLYCLNCHASAETDSTFAALKNITGDPNNFLTQRVPLQASAPAEQTALFARLEPDVHASRAAGAADTAPAPTYAPGFTDTFRIPDVDPAPTDPVSMASQRYDHVWAGPDGAQRYVTADQCQGCHQAGATGLARSNMTVWMGEVSAAATEAGLGGFTNTYADISPYGEWSASPMGLAGRDPIFFAQLASEGVFHPNTEDNKLYDYVQDLCLSCHGAMGRRQLHLDAHGTESSPDCTPDVQEDCFVRADLLAVPYADDPDHNAEMAPFAGLGRDGIACAVCHHIDDQPVDQFATTFTGAYNAGPDDVVYGPFEDPLTKPMDHALGVVPEHNTYTASSELCGSCHTIFLPVFKGAEPVLMDSGKQKFAYEQATYLEWLFSDFRTAEDGSFDGGATPESCQQCHMPSSFTRPDTPDDERIVLTDLASPIATIQQGSYFPEADFNLPDADIDLPVRQGYARHELLGANVFLLDMFRQFPDVLGIALGDYMLGSSATDPLDLSVAMMDDQAEHGTVDVAVVAEADGDGTRATVTVTNLTGHKLPSGVGFRRMFLEVAVQDANGEVLWASGRTNELGLLVDASGVALPGELWWDDACTAHTYDPAQGYPYQPHHTAISAQDQVQVYQELTIAPRETGAVAGFLTTSFLSIDGRLKDNRLLPKGFVPVLDGDELVLGADDVAIAGAIGIDVADPEQLEFLNHVAPTGIGEADGAPDPRYLDGSGSDEIVYTLPSLPGAVHVTATMYSQSIPPFYLQDRFCNTTPEGRADTERLYYLAGNLDVSGTSTDGRKRTEGWRYRLTSASALLP